MLRGCLLDNLFIYLIKNGLVVGMWNTTAPIYRFSSFKKCVCFNPQNPPCSTLHLVVFSYMLFSSYTYCF